MHSPSWTLLPPPSLYHPSGLSQCTSPKHPISCIEPGLATCFIYDIIHVSMPFSQIIPPSSSPTESKRLFYMSMSLLLSRIHGYNLFFCSLIPFSQKWRLPVCYYYLFMLPCILKVNICNICILEFTIMVIIIYTFFILLIN